ncbi:hypothetical protein D3C71_25250 [compost metagenome]
MPDINLQGRPESTFVVHSALQAASGAGFWSNTEGWVEDLAQATTFTEDETRRFRLPVSAGDDARWVPISEAQAIEAAQPKNTFARALAVHLNSMRQDDAVGAIYALRRGDASRQMARLSPHDFEPEDIDQFEFVLFDGGNTAGDLWKCAFFPQQLVFQSVKEQ